MIDKKLFLLSGVHGVGKGFFLKNVLKDDCNYTISEASRLIRQYKDAEDAGYKMVNDVSDNQKILLEALIKEKRRIETDIILDGHLCIINRNGGIEKIPESFFFRVSVQGIILLQDDVDSIIKRQNLRDGVALDKQMISQIQEEEVKYCEVLKNNLKISYSVITNKCTYSQFINKINRMWGELYEYKY